MTGAVRQSAFGRVVHTAILLLHLWVAGLVPFAEAAHAEPSDPDRVHLHAEREGNPCAPSHDHLKCQICRTAGSGHATPSTIPAPDFRGAAVVASIPSDTARPHAAAHRAYASRAPPHA